MPKWNFVSKAQTFYLRSNNKYMRLALNQAFMWVFAWMGERARADSVYCIHSKSYTCRLHNWSIGNCNVIAHLYTNKKNKRKQTKSTLNSNIFFPKKLNTWLHIWKSKGMRENACPFNLFSIEPNTLTTHTTFSNIPHCTQYCQRQQL